MVHVDRAFTAFLYVILNLDLTHVRLGTNSASMVVVDAIVQTAINLLSMQQI